MRSGASTDIPVRSNLLDFVSVHEEQERTVTRKKVKVSSPTDDKQQSILHQNIYKKKLTTIAGCIEQTVLVYC